MEKVAERLQRLRGERSREEVAKAVGVSISAIAMYENGERIKPEILKQINEQLEILEKKMVKEFREMVLN